MVGFKELLRRLKIQEQMTKQHQTRVDVSHALRHSHAGLLCTVVKITVWMDILIQYCLYKYLLESSSFTVSVSVKMISVSVIFQVDP